MSQTKKISRCSHVKNIGDVSWEEIKEKQEGCGEIIKDYMNSSKHTELRMYSSKHTEDQECETCRVKATNLWLCLIGSCHYTGCGESIKDHSSQHAESYKHHVTINLSTLRIWCYMCECEVFHDRNNPPFIIPDKTRNSESSVGGGSRDDNSADSSPHRSVSAAEETDSEDEESTIKPRGLTGLQNLGNTCYLNAALQALSNCPPLTRYFLDCQGYVKPEKNPMLSRSYLKLIKDVWGKKRPSYIVPNGVVSGIKLVHPMFRGFSQQDTQEFLRCFMDQLHEELKQVLIEETDDKEEECQEETATAIGQLVTDRQLSMETSSTSSTSSQSEADYETCDSALGSERSSAEQNFSSDENSDISELSRLNVSPNASPRTKRLHARRIRNSLSKIEDTSDETTDVVVVAKEEKEQINMSKKATENIGMCSEEGSVRNDSMTEYTDAISETEPLQARRTEKKVGTVDREIVTRHSQSKHYKTSSHNQMNNIQHRSVISDIFDGKLSSSVQCLTCERISTTKETFQDLSLPIPSKDHLNMLHSSHHATGSKGGTCSEVHQGWISYMWVWMRSWFLGPVITLQDCLSAFFSADELKGDNMYSCEKCKKLRNGIKFSKVLQLPEVLCIHLKRFRHEFYSSKISTYVAFPLDNLDMNPYLHKDNTSKVTMYDLIAVICHHGTAGGGHYTAYCQNTVSGQWYEYDDQYVTEVDVGQVLNCEAYVLFYRKQNDHMTQMRQDAEELLEAREPSLMQFFVSKQWINKFNTFAEPGPVTNRDFLCRHGGVPPSKVDIIDQLCEPMTQSMWEFLHERFGGGPACNNLFRCTTCQTEYEQLKQRQKDEIESFIKLNEKFKEEDNPSVIYAISMSWFKEWENFVRGKTDIPPGPIENKGISIMKNGQYVVRNNSDHGQLSGEMWQFLYNVYGGGPELIIKQVAPTLTLAAQAQAVKVEKTSSEPQKPTTPVNESTETVKS